MIADQEIGVIAGRRSCGKCRAMENIWKTRLTAMTEIGGSWERNNRSIATAAFICLAVGLALSYRVEPGVRANGSLPVLGDHAPPLLFLAGRFEEGFPPVLLKTNGAQVTFTKNDRGEATALIHRMAGLPDSEGKRLESK